MDHSLNDMVCDRRTCSTLEAAVLASFMVGASMVLAGAIGSITMSLLDRVDTLF